jgi:15-cis-phytoene synthase
MCCSRKTAPLLRRCWRLTEVRETRGLVADTVRTGDYDRYLSTLYAPEAKRPALLALYAFDVEIGGIRDRIREPLAGEMRIQWWHDVIASRKASGHPVADALRTAIDQYNLPALAFENYLSARIFDLYNDPMPTRVDLEGYCGETAGAMIQLSALTLDAGAAMNSAQAAGHAGCATAIAMLLAKMPYHRARGQCYVPRDILSAAGTDPERFVAAKSPEANARAVAGMIALAHEHLAAFRSAAVALPPLLRPAFLHLATVRSYLAKAADTDSQSGRTPTALTSWKRHWLLFRAASTGWRA